MKTFFATLVSVIIVLSSFVTVTVTEKNDESVCPANATMIAYIDQYDLRISDGHVVYGADDIVVWSNDNAVSDVILNCIDGNITAPIAFKVDLGTGELMFD